MAFHQRILFALWGIFLLTVVLTGAISYLLPGGPRNTDERRLARYTVEQVAQTLRSRLAAFPERSVPELIEPQALDFSPLLVIYLLGPDGRDVFERPVPPRVARRLARHPDPGEVASLHVATQGLQGYTLVGRDALTRLPLLLAMARPGGRLLLVLTGLLVSAVSAVLLARFIIRPVRRMRDAGRRVAAGDLSVRVAHTVGNRSDDIAGLAHDFDYMSERVEALLENQQRLMRDVSHELRSPLARLQALLSIARQRATDPDAMQMDRMEREIRRLDELIGSILAFARLEALDGLQRRPTDLTALLREVVADAQLEAWSDDKRIELRGPPRLVCDIDVTTVTQALENVIRNAVHHTRPGTAVRVTVVARAQSVRVVVEDHGEGVPPASIGKLFEPFFRLESGRSTSTGSGGLGLAIAERGVTLHGGTITAENREAGGLRVTMTLPGPVSADASCQGVVVLDA